MKCPYCNSEGHTDDEGSELVGITKHTYLFSHGNCKFCGKYFVWEESK